MKLPQLACMMVIAVGGSSAAAADLAKVDRSIRREPAYRSRPGYCLLVFGPEAKHRAWLVLDGDALYVDRNGNGDLTEEGERVAVPKWEPVKPHPACSQERRIQAGDLQLGGLTHAGLVVVQTRYRRTIDATIPGASGWQAYVDDVWRQTGDGVTCLVYLDLDPRCYGGHFQTGSNERIRHCTSAGWKGFLTFAPRPADAPILHFGGPLTFRVAETELRRGNTPTRLIANLGTVGRGRGAFVEMSHELIPDDLNPLVEVEFPARDPGRPPLVRRFVLDERC
jgi:hypothetical protein